MQCIRLQLPFSPLHCSVIPRLMKAAFLVESGKGGEMHLAPSSEMPAAGLTMAIMVD
jgi:hypothetical protein